MPLDTRTTLQATHDGLSGEGLDEDLEKKRERRIVR
jgi:hypothetical protein